MRNKIFKSLALLLLLMFVVGSCLLIGFDLSIRTLIVIMIMDYMMGINLALHGKGKHDKGILSSTIGFRGITKKTTIIILVTSAYIVDNYLMAQGIRIQHLKDLVVVAFIVNELVSIVENANLIGLRVPQMFSTLIDTLKKVGKK